MVAIEIYVAGQIHVLVGRANRPRTAYFWRDELAAIGIGLHDAFWYSVCSINGGRPLEGVQDDAQLQVFIEVPLPSDPPREIPLATDQEEDSTGIV
jgi:hypothetical protein